MLMDARQLVVVEQDRAGSTGTLAQLGQQRLQALQQGHRVGDGRRLRDVARAREGLPR